MSAQLAVRQLHRALPNVGISPHRYQTTIRGCLTSLLATTIFFIFVRGIDLRIITGVSSRTASRQRDIKRAHQFLTSPPNRAASFRSLDIAHIAVVDGGRMTIVPSDGHPVPTRFGDDATISSVTAPINANTFLKALRFGGCHVTRPLGLFEFISTARVCDKYINANLVFRPSRD
jgi:hypothetical protein